MNVFKAQLALKNYLSQHKIKSVGLVPTMGALHQGHLTLVEKAISENSMVIVSIFVNPTQFDNSSDLNSYPKTLASDIQKLSPFQDKVLVYAPDVSDVYPNTTTTNRYEFGTLETTMEGAYRKGHFQGVATIVHKLLLGFMPSRAYFGEKDYQQLQIVSALVAQHQLPVTIVSCPIIREDDGLAMSSRNVRLSPSHRALAPLIFKILNKSKALKKTTPIEQINQKVKDFFSQHPDFELDYFCIADAQSLEPIKFLDSKKNLRAFIAVKLGGVRLIDNVNF